MGEEQIYAQVSKTGFEIREPRTRSGNVAGEDAQTGLGPASLGILIDAEKATEISNSRSVERKNFLRIYGLREGVRE